MNPEDMLALYRYLRERVRETGLGDFDEAVVSELRGEDLPPWRLPLVYLEALDAEFALHSRQTTQRAIADLNRVLDAHDSPAVEGAELRLDAADAHLVDNKAIDLLADLPDLTPQRVEIQGLLRMLREELQGEIDG